MLLYALCNELQVATVTHSHCLVVMVHVSFITVWLHGLRLLVQPTVSVLTEIKISDCYLFFEMIWYSFFSDGSIRTENAHRGIVCREH